MSHYNVNASVPKTLVQHLIRFVSASGDVSEETAKVLKAVLATEISPELVPQQRASRSNRPTATTLRTPSANIA
jgi:NAD+ synthase (glutamine-hydrolysing)